MEASMELVEASMQVLEASMEAVEAFSFLYLRPLAFPTSVDVHLLPQTLDVLPRTSTSVSQPL